MRRPLTRVVVALLAAAAAFGGVILSGTTPQLGLDLQGGLSVVLAPKGNPPDVGEKLDTALGIIRSRVDALGVAEPEISRQGDTIVVDLPGVEEQRRAREIIGRTAELQFRPVLNTIPVDAAEQLGSTTTVPAAPTDGTVAPGESPTTVPAAEAPPDTTLPEGQSMGMPTLFGRAQEAPPGEPTTTAPGEPTTVPGAGETTTTTLPEAVEAGEEFPADQPILAEDKTGELLYQLGPAELTGEGVDTAKAEFDETTNEWVTAVDFTGEGAAGWNAMAAKYHPTQQPIAIVLDGVVQSAPTFQQPNFPEGSAQITGMENQSEARDLALVLKFGALPIELEQINELRVSPTVGRDQLNAGMIAGATGMILVLLYVLIYYRFLGIVIWITLLVTGLVVYALVAWLGEVIGLTTTLAGVVGLIVSIGIAADSNIVYLERLKEELRSGRTLRSAADRSFKDAFRTIVAADTVTLLGAGLLWLLAIGSVRGFAFFLGLATALDLVVAYFLMHPLVVVIGRSRLRDSRLVRMPGSSPAEVEA